MINGRAVELYVVYFYTVSQFPYFIRQSWSEQGPTKRLAVFRNHPIIHCHDCWREGSWLENLTKRGGRPRGDSSSDVGCLGSMLTQSEVPVAGEDAILGRVLERAAAASMPRSA